MWLRFAWWLDWSPDILRVANVLITGFLRNARFLGFPSLTSGSSEMGFKSTLGIQRRKSAHSVSQTLPLDFFLPAQLYFHVQLPLASPALCQSRWRQPKI